MYRLRTTAARLKLKGIDGGPHKRWSMWFNSMQREEPYLGLTCIGRFPEMDSFLRNQYTGAAWPSSARVVRCLVKSSNERNPCELLPADNAGDSVQTAQINWEEGGDDVRSVWPLRLGLHTCYNARYSGTQYREVEQILKTGPSSDWSLQLDSMKSESLVMTYQL